MRSQINFRKEGAVRGKLIAIEGIDGSGKSVQTALLKTALERLGHPTNIIKAKEARHNFALEKFLKDFEISTDSIAFMFLYQALHRKQYDRTLLAINAGTIVIADRWDLSFFVYHNLFGSLSEQPKYLVNILNELAFENMEPDLCFFLNIDVSTAIKRRIARGDVINSTKEEAKFYEKIVAEYARLLAHKSNCVALDGSQPIEQIHGQILEVVMPLILQG